MCVLVVRRKERRVGAATSLGAYSMVGTVPQKCQQELVCFAQLQDFM
jgi:hypothetical protein